MVVGLLVLQLLEILVEVCPLLLYCDEFAFVSPTIADEFWTHITLATGGLAIITSTPTR